MEIAGPGVPLAIAVVVTLLVYWAAEGYAELLGEQIHAGRLPTREQVRAALAGLWPMVTASYVPLLALLVVDADQEMMAMGAANATAGLFQGFAISGSASRTAAVAGAGGASQLVSLLAAVLVLVTAALLTRCSPTCPSRCRARS